MKRLFSIIICAVLLQGLQQANAQTHTPDALKEGYGMHEGKMVHIANGTISPMTSDVTMENGTKVMQDGTVQLPGKKPEKLRDGYVVNQRGKIVLIEYDMMTYEAIQQHSQKMLGDTETRFIVTEDGTTVILDSSNPEKAKEATEALERNSTVARKATLLSERNNLVIQKANIMNKLTPKETEKNEELKGINARLRQLEQELKTLEEPVQQEQKVE